MDTLGLVWKDSRSPTIPCIFLPYSTSQHHWSCVMRNQLSRKTETTFTESTAIIESCKSDLVYFLPHLLFQWFREGSAWAVSKYYLIFLDLKKCSSHFGLNNSSCTEQPWSSSLRSTSWQGQNLWRWNTSWPSRYTGSLVLTCWHPVENFFLCV